MKTLEMMNKALNNQKTYKSGDMLFNKKKNFHDRHGNYWPGNAFDDINDLLSADWVEKPDREMTKQEAEDTFHIKITG